MADALDIHVARRAQVRDLLQAAMDEDLREVMIIGTGPGDLFWSISGYADRSRVLGQIEILKARILRGIIQDQEVVNL